MGQDHKYTPVRCAENDPHRCQSMTENGQCPFLAVPPTEYCVIHGNHSVRKEETTALYEFTRTEVLDRLKKFRAHPEAMKLTTELGVLRLTLEALLNKCTDNYELVTNSATISSLIGSIERTLTANLKLEKHMNDLLSLTQVIQMAQQFFNVVTQHIKDPEVIEVIATEFEKIMTNPPEANDFK
jgi:hypothetical protein